MKRPRRVAGFGPKGMLGVFSGFRWEWVRLSFGWRAIYALCKTEHSHYDRVYQAWVTEVEYKRVKLPSDEGPRGSRAPHGKMPAALLKFPKLCKFLTARFYDDSDQGRDGGMVCLSAQDGNWWVVLKDPTAKLKVKFELDDPAKLWEALEAVLAQDDVPWVVDPWAKPRVNLKPPRKP